MVQRARMGGAEGRGAMIIKKGGGDVTRDLVLLRGSEGRSSAITRVCVRLISFRDKP